MKAPLFWCLVLVQCIDLCGGYGGARIEAHPENLRNGSGVRDRSGEHVRLNVWDFCAFVLEIPTFNP